MAAVRAFCPSDPNRERLLGPREPGGLDVPVVRRVPSAVIRSLVTGVVVAVLLAGRAAAQEPGVHVGAGPAYAVPTGSLRSYLAGAYGAGAFVAFGREDRALRLRIDADFLRFAPTTASRPYRALQPVSITTGSQLFTALAGPELRLPAGRLRLTAAASAGFATSTNTGAVTGIAAPDRFSGATTFGDFALAWAAGGGVGVRLGDGSTPVWLDLSTRYTSTGPTRWVREGNIPVGYISGVYLKATRSPTTMVSFRLAVSVGVSH